MPIHVVHLRRQNEKMPIKPNTKGLGGSMIAHNLGLTQPAQKGVPSFFFFAKELGKFTREFIQQRNLVNIT